MIVGLIGGLAGGFLMSITHLLVHGAMIYTSLAAVLGGLILTVLVRYAGARYEYARVTK